MNLPQKIDRLEQFMLSKPQRECNVRHMFAPGLYIREVSIPGDTFAVGHYQKCEHLNVMLKGRCVMMNDDGTATRYQAPAVYVGKPGKKAGYVFEDLVWLNVYATSETDIDKLEEMFLIKSDAFKASQKLIEFKSGGYAEMLDEFGVTEEMVRTQSERTDDLIQFPYGEYKIKVGPSGIEGRGVIATSDIAAAEVIALALKEGKRTPAGRYTNHSDNPNACMREGLNGDVYLIAIKPIAGCRGGADGDEVTIDYREAIKIKLRSVK